MHWPPLFARDSDPCGGNKSKELKQVYLKKSDVLQKHFWIPPHCSHDHELEYNHATNLLSFLIADIPYLRSLHLDRNPLQKVEANAFEMIPQLVSLDLSHCNIKRVAARAFAQLTSLEKLFLQHNQISELRQKTVESITGEQKPFRL